MNMASGTLHEEDLYAWTQQQAEHLLKLESFELKKPAEHSRDKIVEWRIQMEKVLTRAIEAKLDLAARYRVALRFVRRLERDVPGMMSRIPAECPYTFEQILGAGGEDWFPTPGIDRHSGSRA
jgi:uncharacterized protein DUF29